MSNSALRNNSGGFFNHCLFWGNNRSKLWSENPSGDLLNSITDNFESFENLKICFLKLQQLDLDLDGHGYVSLKMVN